VPGRKAFFHLAQNAVEIDRILCIHVDQRSKTERSEGSQSLEVGDQFIAALVSIQMPVMAFASREALGRDRGRTEAVDFDDLPWRG
jgi:hypothetical protein